MNNSRARFNHLKLYWFPLLKTIRNPVKSVINWKKYLSDWHRYGQLSQVEKLSLWDSAPQLFDATPTTYFAADYFYQAVWAMEKIIQSRCALHVDIGSDSKFVGMVSAYVETVMVDIRPLVTGLDRLHSVSGSILSLPFNNGSIKSLSCLHVAEHIGLGRFGDPLDPLGTQKACADLSRVLCPGGDLFFSVPIGSPRVCFNAHRIFDPAQITAYFSGLKLIEFSAVDDDGKLCLNADPAKFAACQYSCGLFHFSKLPADE